MNLCAFYFFPYKGSILPAGEGNTDMAGSFYMKTN